MLPLRHFSRRRHETLKAQGQSVSIGEVLGAIWQMYGSAMEPLQGFEHRAIVLREQALVYMEPIVGIDADQVGIKGGMMDLRNGVPLALLVGQIARPYRRRCGRRQEAKAPVIQITRNDRYTS
jgi:hypothetical protein